MKSIKFFFTAILVLILGTHSFAQTRNQLKTSASTTETFSVAGNCESCQARIEKAASIAGVSSAKWNIKTKKLTLVFNPSKVKRVDVQKKIAAVGHDTGIFKATDLTYNALPACCKYRSSKK